MIQFWEIKMEISIIILSHEICNSEIISFSVFFNLVIYICSKLSISRQKVFAIYKRTSNDDKIEIFRKHSSNEYKINGNIEYCAFVTFVALSWIKILPVVIQLHNLKIVYHMFMRNRFV